MTFEEYLNWLNEETLADWVGGKISYHNFPRTITHQQILNFLACLVQVFAEENKLGKVVTLKYPMYLPNVPSARQSDIMFVSNSRKNIFTEYYLKDAADLIIEVNSPESRTRDKGDKFYEYEQAGVREFWLIDPDRKRAEFYTLGEDGFFNFEVPENGVFHSKILEGLTLKVEWLWQETLPTLMEVKGFPIKIENKVVKSYFKVTKLKKVNEYATLSRR